MKHWIALLLSAASLGLQAAAPAPRTLAEWTFDQPGDFQGWQPNGQVSNAVVAAGELAFATTGDDPILELRPRLDVPASARQYLEVRLKADRDGEAGFFWSNTSQGKYGGFDGKKFTPFQVLGDGQWHVYRIFPGWQTEGKIIRLRFDPYGGARFALDSLRLQQMPEVPAAAELRFEFRGSSRDWLPAGGLTAATMPEGIQVSQGGAGTFLMSPPLQVDAAENTFVTVRMRASRGKHGAVLFASSAAPGWHALAFPIIADGQEHDYNVDLLPAADWKGRVVALGLRPTDAADAQATVSLVAVAAEPVGPPQLKVLGFALADAAPRAGVDTWLKARIANLGGGALSNLDLQLQLPAGVTVVSNPPPGLLRAALAYADEAEVGWRIRSGAPVRGRAILRASAMPAAQAVAEAELDIQARPSLPKSAYVPMPKPVRGPYEVGAYYFPGWKTASQWQPIQKFPERTPMLGWYREGDPEVADWQIKWAVEHGITFFAYDWYWSKGARHLEHGLHEGYFNARYRQLLKFCLLWANHNPPQTHSLADCLDVTRYWITNYFTRPEYLRLDGKPVVILFSPYNLVTDLGAEGVNRAFAAMREECRKAGLPGLFLAACVGGPHQVDGQAYDAVTAYNWPGLGMAGKEKQAPFAPLAEGYRKQWQRLLQGPAPLLTPICGGWDSRPWHGDSALVRTERTPAAFRQHLQDARRLLEANPANTNLLKAVLVEAWNEWGEGSYIEPHKEYGFGYLDAIRAVFARDAAPHADLAPADVGLGPYDVPPMPAARTAWDFAAGPQGWDNTMHLDQFQATNGSLRAVTAGNDPAIFGPPIQARAQAFGALKLRLRLTALAGRPFQDRAQVFWATRRWPESEASSERFEVQVDGQWHEYRVPLAASRRWTGTVTRLRLDPLNRAGVRVELGALALEAK